MTGYKQELTGSHWSFSLPGLPMELLISFPGKFLKIILQQICMKYILTQVPPPPSPPKKKRRLLYFKK